MKPAREPASSRPKLCASLKKPHESCPFDAPCGPRRKKNDRGQRSAFPSETSRFGLSISRAQGLSPPLARQRSSCSPPSPNLVRTHLIENYQALRGSAPCLSRAATLPKTTKLELGRGAHLKTPSSANHTAAASQPTGRIAKARRKTLHTHTPKPGFGGRGHEVVYFIIILRGQTCPKENVRERSDRSRWYVLPCPNLEMVCSNLEMACSYVLKVIGCDGNLICLV